MHFNFPIAAQSIRESIIILYKAKIPIHIEEKLAKGRILFMMQYLIIFTAQQFKAAV